MIELRADLPIGKAMSLQLNDAVPLPYEEVTYLFTVYKDPLSSTKKKESIAKMLFKHNTRLVSKMCSNTKFLTRGIPSEDVFQEGCIGLMEAISRYDLDRGVKFSTYACYWIKSAIDKLVLSIGRTVRLPAHAEIASRKMNSEAAKFREHEGHEPTVEQLAVLSKTSNRITKATYHSSGSMISIHTPSSTAEDCNSTLEDRLPDHNVSQFEAVSDKEFIDSVKEILVNLPEREQVILMLRYGLNDCNIFAKDIGYDIEEEDDELPSIKRFSDIRELSQPDDDDELNLTHGVG